MSPGTALAAFCRGAASHADSQAVPLSPAAASWGFLRQSLTRLPAQSGPAVMGVGSVEGCDSARYVEHTQRIVLSNTLCVSSSRVPEVGDGFGLNACPGDKGFNHDTVS